MLGSWRLVPEKSDFQGQAPQSERRIYTAHPAGLQTTIIRIDGSGAHSTISYVADYDNLDYPVVGSGAVDTITWLPIDQRSGRVAEATARHGDVVIATVRRSLSEDGNMMTVTVQSPGDQPEVRVYERDDSP